MLSYLTTFIAVFVVDIFYTYYLKSINENKAITAGFWGAVVWLIGSIAVIEYTADHMLLIPACIGAFFGTWVGIKIRNRGDKTL
jgi:O-antigen/teichoic acid export membrane protein